MLGSASSESHGALVARFLTGSWRPSPPPLPHSLDLAAILPLLLASGTGGLSWWRIHRLPASRTEAGRTLRQAYRHQALLARLHQDDLRRALEIFRSAGVEPLVVKGLALARLYPSLAVRPYGDIDLRVGPEDWTVASVAREQAIEAGCPVDIRAGFSKLEPRAWNDVWARSIVVDLGGVEARVPAAEDHLRLVCLHLLGHGAWRPLWLCDVAVLVESRSADLDWDYLLCGEPRATSGVLAALALARHLLEVPLETTPIAARTERPPRWLLRAVLRAWGVAHRPRASLAHHLRMRQGVLDSVRRSWPDPVTATAEVRAPFNRFPRWPIQLWQATRRAAQIAAAEGWSPLRPRGWS